ncbi:MAG TPA: alpha-1,4-glucan--maltose-1-phosphate maltosyltransferase [Polyangiaceae bacterium]|nr:alpha-1,4-glucan--maltose-1-phosphate maltosyltransferase [Polyangiaceae bacterium]
MTTPSSSPELQTEPSEGTRLPAPEPPAGLGDGRRRVFIQGVKPEIDAGRYPVKRIVGDRMIVECDIVSDGHDIVRGALHYRARGAPTFEEVPLESLGNDRFRASFVVSKEGIWEYTFSGWTDAFATWRRGFQRKVEAGQDVAVDLLIGVELIEAAAARGADVVDAQALGVIAKALRAEDTSIAARTQTALRDEVASWMARAADRTFATHYPRVLEIVVDRQRARFSAWYEFFPRSFGQDGKHGTLRDAEGMLPYVAEMGFDILYLPPIHPIGRAYRKGRNNSTTAQPGEPGSPWAIGAEEGGHKAVHPELGTLEDFDRFVARAREHNIEIALDIAFQVSPDHPYVKEHPEWFKKRPDGTIQYAENPPKKYQDVYPFDFETPAWQPLWQELRSVFEFWIHHGVRVFRVDNPHTKPLPFWEWCITTLKAAYPDVLFLAEAFTRPKVMYTLAKGGFTQSYTYFTWRTTKQELTAYMLELTKTDVAEFYGPNFWPNTPDILPEHLQTGLRSAFIGRLILASTLSSCYGMYGPAFELMEHVPRPGAEEYIDNEKYELKRWDLERPDSLRHIIARVNTIRRTNTALQANKNLAFHPTTNDFILAYSKRSDDGKSVILVVVNLDAHHTHSAWIDLDLAELGLKPDEGFQVHDLLSEARFIWRGGRAYVELDPNVIPAHIFRLRRFVRTEQDFEYYL